jgi:hypothetical protein
MPPSGEPAMRGAHTRSLFAAVQRLPEGERARVLAAAGSEVVTEIERAFGLSWLSMDIHMRLSDAVRDVVGPKRNAEVWRATMAMSYERPILKSFVHGAVDLFGLTPSTLLRQGPRVYEHLTRNLGKLTFDPGPRHEATVRLRGFPASRYRFACYVEGLAGCIESTVALGHATGEVVPRDVVESRGEVTYSVRWVEPRSRE